MSQGNATLVEHISKLKVLQSYIVKEWLPRGLEETDIILIKVTPKEVNYQTSSSSKMVDLFNILKAIVTEKVYGEGEHGKFIYK